METNQHQQSPEKTDNPITDYYDNGLDQVRLKEYETGIKKARSALFVAAAAIFVGEMVVMFRNWGGFEATIFITALVESGIFIGLAIWTKKKPYTAILLGLITFIVFIVLAVVGNGMMYGSGAAGRTLISGIFIKIFVLAALIQPLKKAKELQASKKRMVKKQ